jgi:hypothetical protein
MSVIVSVKNLPDTLQRIVQLPADQQLLFRRSDLSTIENGTIPDKLSFGHPELHSSAAAQLTSLRLTTSTCCRTTSRAPIQISRHSCL